MILLDSMVFVMFLELLRMKGEGPWTPYTQPTVFQMNISNHIKISIVKKFVLYHFSSQLFTQ